MSTPIFQRDPVGPTLKLHHPLHEDPPPQPDLRTTPLPVQLGPGFPRVRGYEILSIVGHGGMGIVYEARHIELNRRVAIKTLRGEALADPDFRERFRAEAEAIARVQHPGIIQVFEVGTIEPHADEMFPSPFIALEFVDGGSLTKYTSSPQLPREAAKMVETLARAAHAAHRLGVVHRDLKPANVLLTRDGAPKIADFGIAKRIDVECAASERFLTRDGTVMGTPEYMAPEHLKGRAASPAIDVYALGVILYELLTGRVPFQGATFADTMLLVLRQEPVSPRRLQPSVPRDLETICLKCLEKNPTKRYESADELADDLARWAEGRAIKARAVGVIGHTVRWARRNPMVAALSVAVLVLAVIGVAGIVWQWRDAQSNANRAEAEATKARDAAHKERAAADKERWERYRVSVFAASSALRLHDTNGARRALEEAPPEHRDWVWNLLNAQLDRSREVVIGPGTRFGHAEFTHDGAFVLLRDPDLRVWDLRTGARTHPAPALPRGHTDPRLSPDGTTFATVTVPNEVTLYDVSPWRERTVLRGHSGHIFANRFSPDGAKYLTFASDYTARTWNARTGECLHVAQFPSSVQGTIDISADLSAIILRRDISHDPSVWDARTGHERFVLRGHTWMFRMARFSPAGDRVVTCEEYPTNALRLWDVATGRLLATLAGHDNELNHLEFSRDGTKLVTCSVDRSVRVWDLTQPMKGAEQQARHVFEGHTGRVDHVTFSADGRRVVSTAADHTARYWDVEHGKLLAVLRGHTDVVLRAGFAADGKTVHTASRDGTVRAWPVADLEADYALRGHTNFAYSVAFHPDDVRFGSSAWDGTARVWDAVARRELRALSHGGTTPDAKIVSAVAIHRDGKLLATLARDDAVRLWDIDSGKEVHRFATKSGHWCDSRLAFSADGALLAAGDREGNVRIWNVHARTEYAVIKGHVCPVRDVAFSPDGKFIASAGETGDNTVRVYDVATKTEVKALRVHTEGVYTLAWNPTGTLLATGSYDKTVRLWSTTTWEEVGDPLKQGTTSHSIAFSRDGKLLAVGCADNLIRIWDVETRQALAELSGHKGYVHSLAFSPNGERLISASGDKTIRVWDTVPTASRGK